MLFAVLAVIALVVAGGAYVLTQDDDGITAEGEVFLESWGTPGPDPFDEVVAVAPPPDALTRVDAPTTPPISSSDAAVLVSTSGRTPGLYGGTQLTARCDRVQMQAFLAANPDKAAAWVAAQNADPTFRWAGGSTLSVADVGAYIDTLTPVTLHRDTRVTNHGFAGGQPTPRQSVLQVGTAVLVDEYGVPRARCACGNPLVPPEAMQGTVTYTGQPWDGFEPSTTVVVQPAPEPIGIFILTGNVSGDPFARPAGTAGEEDADAEDVDLDPPPTATSTPPTTTGSGGGTGAYCDAWDDLWASTGGDLASLSIQQLADAWRDLTAVAPSDILPAMQHVQGIWDRGAATNTSDSLYDSVGPDANAVAEVSIYVREACGLDIGGD